MEKSPCKGLWIAVQNHVCACPVLSISHVISSVSHDISVGQIWEPPNSSPCFQYPFSCSSRSRQSSGFYSLDPHFRNHNPDRKSSQSGSNPPVLSLPTSLSFILCSRHCKHIRSTLQHFHRLCLLAGVAFLPSGQPSSFSPIPLSLLN